MSTAADRRQFLRSVFHAPVRLRLGGHESQAVIHDISLRGALVEVSPDWGGKAGDVCELRLVLAPDTTIRMRTRVMHVRGQHAGLHCDHIDLDSMTHLRQLVEHNAADPALLDRELASLVTH